VTVGGAVEPRWPRGAGRGERRPRGRDAGRNAGASSRTAIADSPSRMSIL